MQSELLAILLTVVVRLSQWLVPVWAVVAAIWKPLAAVWFLSFSYCVYREARKFYDPVAGLRGVIAEISWFEAALTCLAAAPWCIIRNWKQRRLIRRLRKSLRTPNAGYGDLADEIIDRTS